jgi:hypothetical protein
MGSNEKIWWCNPADIRVPVFEIYATDENDAYLNAREVLAMNHYKPVDFAIFHKMGTEPVSEYFWYPSEKGLNGVWDWASTHRKGEGEGE